MRAGARAEQLREDERAAKRRGELPAIPVERHRSDRLEMPHLRTPAEQPDVGLDEGDAESLRVTQLVEAVSRAVRDDERRAPVGGPLGHLRRHPRAV